MTKDELYDAKMIEASKDKEFMERTMKADSDFAYVDSEILEKMNSLSAKLSEIEDERLNGKNGYSIDQASEKISKAIDEVTNRKEK